MAILISLVVFVAVMLLVISFSAQREAATESEGRDIYLRGLVQRRSRWLYSPVLLPLTYVLNAYNRALPAPKRKARIERLLVMAGYPGELTTIDFLTVCEMSGLAVSGALTALFFLGTGRINLFTITLPTFLLGLAAPYWWLKDRARSRTRSIGRELPYGLDLIALSVGAGSTFNEALETLIREGGASPLNEEFRQVIGEISMGRTRTEALLNLGRRIPLDELKSIVSAIIQGETLGTPLTDVLRMQADLLRLKRSVRAEKLAGEAAVKILLPSVLILMSVLIMVLGPVLVRAAKGQLY